MRYSESEARALVVQAGHRLVACGLVARTWGNISARVSDTHFVITPVAAAMIRCSPKIWCWFVLRIAHMKGKESLPVKKASMLPPIGIVRILVL